MRTQKDKKGKEFVCPVCMEELKHPSNLVCRPCFAFYKEEKRKRDLCNIPFESLFSYTIGCAKENLASCTSDLWSLEASTKPYWDAAYKAVSKESPGWKKDFLKDVLKKFRESLIKNGLKEKADEIENLKNEMRILKQAIGWLEKIAAMRKAKAENREINKKTKAENVIQETAAA